MTIPSDVGPRVDVRPLLVRERALLLDLLSGSTRTSGAELAEHRAHRQQVAHAVGRPTAAEPDLCVAGLDVFCRGLPETLRPVAREPGTSLLLRVPDVAACWSVVRRTEGWAVVSSPSSSDGHDAYVGRTVVRPSRPRRWRWTRTRCGVSPHAVSAPRRGGRAPASRATVGWATRR